jgi:hypothetical protein
MTAIARSTPARCFAERIPLAGDCLSEMSRHQIAIKSVILGLAALSLSACASSRTPGEHIADMPHWMGGLPANAPPRRNSPEFDEWMAKRAQEAARPKIEQPQPK